MAPKGPTKKTTKAKAKAPPARPKPSRYGGGATMDDDPTMPESVPMEIEGPPSDSDDEAASPVLTTTAAEAGSMPPSNLTGVTASSASAFSLTPRCTAGSLGLPGMDLPQSPSGSGVGSMPRSPSGSDTHTLPHSPSNEHASLPRSPSVEQGTLPHSPSPSMEPGTLPASPTIEQEIPGSRGRSPSMEREPDTLPRSPSMEQETHPRSPSKEEKVKITSAGSAGSPFSDNEEPSMSKSMTIAQKDPYLYSSPEFEEGSVPISPPGTAVTGSVPGSSSRQPGSVDAEMSSPLMSVSTPATANSNSRAGTPQTPIGIPAETTTGKSSAAGSATVKEGMSSRPMSSRPPMAASSNSKVQPMSPTASDWSSRAPSNWSLPAAGSEAPSTPLMEPGTPGIISQPPSGMSAFSAARALSEVEPDDYSGVGPDDSASMPTSAGQTPESANEPPTKRMRVGTSTGPQTKTSTVKQPSTPPESLPHNFSDDGVSAWGALTMKESLGSDDEDQDEAKEWATIAATKADIVKSSKEAWGTWKKGDNLQEEEQSEVEWGKDFKAASPESGAVQSDSRWSSWRQFNEVPKKPVNQTVNQKSEKEDDDQPEEERVREEEKAPELTEDPTWRSWGEHTLEATAARKLVCKIRSRLGPPRQEGIFECPEEDKFPNKQVTELLTAWLSRRVDDQRAAVVVLMWILACTVEKEEPPKGMNEEAHRLMTHERDALIKIAKGLPVGRFMGARSRADVALPPLKFSKKADDCVGMLITEVTKSVYFADNPDVKLEGDSEEDKEFQEKRLQVGELCDENFETKPLTVKILALVHLYEWSKLKKESYSSMDKLAVGLCRQCLTMHCVEMVARVGLEEAMYLAYVAVSQDLGDLPPPVCRSAKIETMGRLSIDWKINPKEEAVATLHFFPIDRQLHILLAIERDIEVELQRLTEAKGPEQELREKMKSYCDFRRLVNGYLKKDEEFFKKHDEASGQLDLVQLAECKQAVAQVLRKLKQRYGWSPDHRSKRCLNRCHWPARLSALVRLARKTQCLFADGELQVLLREERSKAITAEVLSRFHHWAQMEDSTKEKGAYMPKILSAHRAAELRRAYAEFMPVPAERIQYVAHEFGYAPRTPAGLTPAFPFQGVPQTPFGAPPGTPRGPPPAFQGAPQTPGGPPPATPAGPPPQTPALGSLKASPSSAEGSAPGSVPSPVTMTPVGPPPGTPAAILGTLRAPTTPAMPNLKSQQAPMTPSELPSRAPMTPTTVPGPRGPTTPAGIMAPSTPFGLAQPPPSPGQPPPSPGDREPPPSPATTAGVISPQIADIVPQTPFAAERAPMTPNTMNLMVPVTPAMAGGGAAPMTPFTTAGLAPQTPAIGRGLRAPFTPMGPGPAGAPVPFTPQLPAASAAPQTPVR